MAKGGQATFETHCQVRKFDKDLSATEIVWKGQNEGKLGVQESIKKPPN